MEVTINPQTEYLTPPILTGEGENNSYMYFFSQRDREGHFAWIAINTLFPDSLNDLIDYARGPNIDTGYVLKKFGDIPWARIYNSGKEGFDTNNTPHVFLAGGTHQVDDTQVLKQHNFNADEVINGRSCVLIHSVTTTDETSVCAIGSGDSFKDAAEANGITPILFDNNYSNIARTSDRLIAAHLNDDNKFFETLEKSIKFETEIKEDATTRIRKRIVLHNYTLDNSTLLAAAILKERLNLEEIVFNANHKENQEHFNDKTKLYLDIEEAEAIKKTDPEFQRLKTEALKQDNNIDDQYRQERAESSAFRRLEASKGGFGKLLIEQEIDDLPNRGRIGQNIERKVTRQFTDESGLLNQETAQSFNFGYSVRNSNSSAEATNKAIRSATLLLERHGITHVRIKKAKSADGAGISKDIETTDVNSIESFVRKLFKDGNTDFVMEASIDIMKTQDGTEGSISTHTVNGIPEDTLSLQEVTTSGEWIGNLILTLEDAVKMGLIKSQEDYDRIILEQIQFSKILRNKYGIIQFGIDRLIGTPRNKFNNTEISYLIGDPNIRQTGCHTLRALNSGYKVTRGITRKVVPVDPSITRSQFEESIKRTIHEITSELDSKRMSLLANFIRYISVDIVVATSNWSMFYLTGAEARVLLNLKNEVVRKLKQKGIIR